jgi:tellurite resistance protein
MAETESRIRFLPISFFAMVMGLSGLSLALQQAARIWGLPAVIGETAIIVSALVFLALASLYGTKVVCHGAEVVAEFRHPVKVNFFPTATISLLLLSAGFIELNIDVARALWFVGAIAHLVLTLMVLSAWINRTTFEVQHMNPAWFIPVVGNVIVPIAGVQLGAPEVSWFFFSIGIVYWLVLLAIIFNRVIFHHPIAERLVPTFFILIAPPAVGFLAYVRLVGWLDPMARVLFNTALFTALLLATQWRMFFRIKFYLSWWAYSFPLAALTLATMAMYHLTKSDFMQLLAATLLFLLAATITALLWLTARAAQRNEICTPDA